MFRKNALTKAIMQVILGVSVLGCASKAFAQGGTWTTKEPMPMPRPGSVSFIF